MTTLDPFGSLTEPERDRDDLFPTEIEDDVWKANEVVVRQELIATAPAEFSRALRSLPVEDDDEDEKSRQRLPPIRLVNMGPKITLTTSCLEPHDQALRNVEPLVRRTSDEIFHEPERSIWRRGAGWLLRITNDYPIPIAGLSIETCSFVELAQGWAAHAINRSPVTYVSTTDSLRSMSGETAGRAALSMKIGALELSSTNTPPALSALAAAPAPPSTAEQVRYVHKHLGLTWDQIARIFSVSRRAALYWAAGEKMSSAKEELLGQLYAVVQELPGETAADRRAALMTRRGREDSYWAEFTRRGGPGYVIGGPAVTAAQASRLGLDRSVGGGDAAPKDPGEQ